MIEMIKYLIWDFDGVICNSRSIAFKVHNIISYEYNLKKIKSRSDYLKILDNNTLNRCLSTADVDNYYEKHRTFMYKYRDDLKLFDDVVEYIKNNNIESIIITATYEKLVKDVFIKEGYSPLIFKYILGRETFGGKNEKVDKLCDLLNISKNEILYIGDTINDVNFCSNMNIPILVSGYGYSNVDGNSSKSILKVCKTRSSLINTLKKLLSNT